MQLNKILLVVVLILALFLRIWKLDDVPAGFYSDEASIGYDAFSILHTGRDFHGNSLPLFFESFGEWKNPIYIYASVPSIALFGLNEFATRLPAALFGLLAVLALFLVAKELFSEELALLASAFLAVSPWALQFSRVAFEAFALCLYSYGAGRLFVPLFLVALLFIFRADLIAKKKQLVIPAVIFLLLSLPLVITALFSPEVVFSRVNKIGIFAQGHSPFEFLDNYVQYFSAEFLFYRGDANLRHSPPGYGQLLWFSAPLLPAGIAACLLSFDKRNKLLFAWLLLFPVTAALTFEGSPHAIRSIVGVGLFELFAAAGATLLFGLARRLAGQRIAIMSGLLFILLAGANAFMFTSDYFSKYPSRSAAWFESGLGDAFKLEEKT